MKKTAAIAIVLALCFLAVWYFQPRVLIRWLADLDPDVLYSVETDEKVVALTIDDGPNSEVTPQILDVLGENDAHATFFVLGDRIESNEDVLADIRNGGHEIANHLLADYPSILIHSEEFEKQLLQVQSDAGIDTTGTKWFRPGMGCYNSPMKKKLAKNNYRLCLASVYPHDTVVRSRKMIAWYILRRVSPGDIIVLHDGTADRVRTAEVLRTVLPALKERGYDVVTLSELDGRFNISRSATIR